MHPSTRKKGKGARQDALKTGQKSDELELQPNGRLWFAQVQRSSGRQFLPPDLLLIVRWLSSGERHGRHLVFGPEQEERP